MTFFLQHYNAHTVNETINKGDIDNKLIMGDFNVTLNHVIDSYGYKTDPHPKSRRSINGWLDNETFIDTFRYFHPDTPSYTEINPVNSSQGLIIVYRHPP